MRAVLLILPILLLAWSPLAHAHSDKHFDGIETPHDGQIRMAGPYHLELVVGSGEVSIYVTDHGDQPIETSGGSAKVIITSGKKRYVVVLAPAGDNRLEGSGEFKLGRSNAVSVMVVLPGQEPQRATFSIKRASGKKTK